MSRKPSLLTQLALSTEQWWDRGHHEAQTHSFAFLSSFSLYFSITLSDCCVARNRTSWTWAHRRCVVRRYGAAPETICRIVGTRSAAMLGIMSTLIGKWSFGETLKTLNITWLLTVNRLGPSTNFIWSEAHGSWGLEKSSSVLHSPPSPSMSSAIATKLLNVCSGIFLCSIVAHFLSLYISWCPELDFTLLAIIIALNASQLLV